MTAMSGCPVIYPTKLLFASQKIVQYSLRSLLDDVSDI